MKKVEITGLILILVLILFRLFGGMQLHVTLRVIMVLISIFYMWFGFFLFNEVKLKDLISKKRRRTFTTPQIASSILAGFIYSLSFITLVHVLEFYRGMNFLTVFSLLLNLFLILAGLFYTRYKKEYAAFFQQFTKRSIFYVLLFGFVWIVPIEKKLHVLYKEHPRFIEAYIAHMEDPDDPEKLNHLREERSAFR